MSGSFCALSTCSWSRMMTLSGFNELARVTVGLRSVSALHSKEVLPPARDLSGVPKKERLAALFAGTFGSGPQPLKVQDKAFGSEQDAVESTGHMEGSETSQPLKK